jgi:regulator of telomere elongation helicase 1
LTTSDIGHCIKSVDHLLNELTEDSTIPLTELDDDTEKKLVYLANLKDVCLNLESALDSIELQPNTTNDVTLPGSYIFDYFGKGGISMQTFGIFLEQCDQAILALSTNTSIHHSGSYLQKLLDAVKIVFTSSCPIGMSIRNVASLHYKVYVKLEDVKTKYSNDVWSNEDNTKGSNSNTSAARKLCYWCFNPGHAMCELQREGVKSIILTSGTLSPIESFSAELQL